MIVAVSGDVAVLVTYNRLACYPSHKQNIRQLKQYDLHLKTIEAAYNNKQKQVRRAATIPSLSFCLRLVLELLQFTVRLWFWGSSYRYCKCLRLLRFALFRCILYLGRCQLFYVDSRVCHFALSVTVFNLL